MRLWRVVLLTLLLSACATLRAPTRIYNAHPLVPEIWYQTLYLHVRKCAETLDKFSNVNYKDIEWFVVSAGELGEYGRAPGGDGHFAGVSSPPNRIYLDERYVVNLPVLVHELGHVLLAGSDGLHGTEAFDTCTNVPQ